jgi:hypothetical protein
VASSAFGNTKSNVTLPGVLTGSKQPFAPERRKAIAARSLAEHQATEHFAEDRMASAAVGDRAHLFYRTIRS